MSWEAPVNVGKIRKKANTGLSTFVCLFRRSITHLPTKRQVVMESVSRPKWTKVKNLHRILSKEAINLQISWKKFRSNVHFRHEGFC